MIERFLEDKMDDIIDLYKTTYDAIIQDETQELFNWSELVIRYSHELFDTRSMTLSMKKKIS